MISNLTPTTESHDTPNPNTPVSELSIRYF